MDNQVYCAIVVQLVDGALDKLVFGVPIDRQILFLGHCVLHS